MQQVSCKYQPFLEALEPRRLLASSPVPLFTDTNDEQDIVYDAARSRVYVTSVNGQIGRFDLTSNEALGYWTVGQKLNGSADITPDGTYLLVGETDPVAKRGIVHRVDLRDGSVSDFAYDLSGSLQGPGWIVATANGKALFTAGSGVPLRQFDIVTGQISEFRRFSGFDQDVDAPKLRRSDDYNTVFLTDHKTFDGRAAIYDSATDRFTTIVDQWSSDFSVVSADGSMIASGMDIRDRELNIIVELPKNELPYAFDPVRPILYTIGPEAPHMSAFDTSSGAKLYDFPLDRPTGSRYPTSFHFSNVAITANGLRMFVLRRSIELEFSISEYALSDRPVILDAPARVAIRHAQTFAIAAQNRTGNAVTDYSAVVSFASDDPAAILPSPVILDPASGSRSEVAFAFQTGGIHTFTAINSLTGVRDTIEVMVDDQPPGVRMETGAFDASRAVGIGIHLDDEMRVDVGTIGDGDVTVLTPDGDALPVDFKYHSGQTPGSIGQEVLAHYNVAPPGGRWDFRDNGVYTIVLHAGAVTDDVGNPVPETTLEFTVDVPRNSPRDDYVEPPPQDLAVSFIEDRFVNSMMAGTKFRPTIVLKNVGSVLINGKTYVTVRLRRQGSASGDPSGELAGFSQRLHLNPGQSKRVTLKVEMFDSAFGNYYLRASATAPAGTNLWGFDGDMANNSVSSPMIGVSERRAELRYSGPAEPIFNDGLDKKQRITFVIRNTGNVPAGGQYTFRVRGAFADEQDPEQPYQGIVDFDSRLFKKIHLRPGQQKSITLNVELSGLPGRYHVWLAIGNYVPSVDILPGPLLDA
jgi:hypothetical protein